MSRTSRIWLLVALALTWVSPALAGTLVGRVIGVTDGDTLTVVDSRFVQHKVRLSGIDAPEKSQPFGNVSRQHLALLTFGRHVTVEGTKRDRYKRTVGKVLVGGVDANLAQIEAGLAWHYREYAREQTPTDRRTYAEAEVTARAKRNGLWLDSRPVAPWEYRKARR